MSRRPILVLLSCALATLAVSAPVALGRVHATPLGVAQRLLKTGDLPGFKAPPPNYVELSPTAESWSKGFPHSAAEAARLQKLGFVAAAFEHLAAQQVSNDDAISVAEEFKTAAGARANAAHMVATYRAGTAPVTRFAVDGIPGATGFHAHRPDGAGFDVIFADGRFAYDVGAYTPIPTGPPTAAQVAAAALKLYQRVHGHPAGSS